jgi:hypothetical protein
MNLKIQNIRRNLKIRIIKYRLVKIFIWTIRRIKAMIIY